MSSPILKLTPFARQLNEGALDKLVDDMLAKETLKAIPSLTWNHGKILAVNGQTLMTGGINYYDEYTSSAMHDIADSVVQIQGEAAISAHRWADYFWRYDNHEPSTKSADSQISC